jgi:hypothetical protein
LSHYNNIKKQLLAENSRRNVNLTAYAIGGDEEMFRQLVKIMIKEPAPYNFRATWVFTAITDEQPWLIEQYLEDIIPLLNAKQSDGILRCLLRQLSRITIPEEHQGILFDICFSFSENTKYALAIRANAMSVLYEISNQQPELKGELLPFFEQIGLEKAPAMIARSRLLLKKLYKEIQKL